MMVRYLRFWSIVAAIKRLAKIAMAIATTFVDFCKFAAIGVSNPLLCHPFIRPDKEDIAIVAASWNNILQHLIAI